MKKNIILAISIVLLGGFYTFNSNNFTAIVQAAQTQTVKPISATSLAIVANPNKYLNKTVKMQATFDKFSTLGLDYDKALRKSSDYIGILI